MRIAITQFMYHASAITQRPHSHILMRGRGGGGSGTGSYFTPKKIPTSEFVYPKTKSLPF